ncbi:hypothetical protein PRUPE_2G042300 [Prunus persica]|uniref:Uncharacterized protein n=1 Tax=Prunus persica TaxID=3760 RepID=A0A251QC00_PRUPE|nr:hypothetical protein PRUPE_2G042300 [Prunus persica]
MVRLKFPITTFSLCSQSNLALKTQSLLLLMFSKFNSTSSLTQVAANHPIVLWQGCCFLFICSLLCAGKLLEIIFSLNLLRMRWWVWPRRRFFRWW